MAVMESNRVVMKMHVSYTDHPHIIGKGGFRIKRVMADTHCLVHFPDSNRINNEEKSNIISVAGEISAIEKARARVRELSPLIFCFELPNVVMHSSPGLTSPFVVSVKESYNVEVIFRTRANSTLVLVKGCDWEREKLQEATVHLINHMCEAFANQVSVQMMLDISPQCHDLVLGMDHQNLKTIMQQTGVQVMIPDASDPNIPSLRKNRVCIIGSINNVYLARQMLIGSLPLVLMFDVMSEVLSADLADSAFLQETMKSLDVFISIIHKPKQNIYSVYIKGLERNATNIYEARRRIIGSKEKAIIANIPSTYQVSGNVPTFLKSFLVGNQFHGLTGAMLGNTNGRGNILSPQGINPLLTISSDLRLGLQSIMDSPTNKGLTDKSQQLDQTAVAAPMLQQLLPKRNNGVSGISEAQYSSLSSTTNCLSSPAATPRTTSPSQGFEAPKISDTNEVQDRRAPGFERSVGNFGYMDYQQLKFNATQAMLGISSETLTKKNTDDGNINDGIKRSDEGNGDNSLGVSASSYLGSMSNFTTNVVASSNYSDLPSHLTSLGLGKYTQLFESNEIDLAIFQTLTEEDLKEIGINALGARRKMLLFITELRRRGQRVFRGSAAPGAERKMCYTNSSPRNDNNDNYW